MFAFSAIYRGYPNQTKEYLFDLIRLELEESDPVLFTRIARAYDRANEFFTRAEEDEKIHSRSGEPLINHPLRVALLLLHERFYDADVLCSAILHNVCTKTNYALQHVRAEFGLSVTQYIEAIEKLSDAEKEVSGHIPSEEKRSDNVFLPLLDTLQNVQCAFFIRFADRLDVLYTLRSRDAAFASQKIEDTMRFLYPLTKTLETPHFTAFFDDAIFHQNDPVACEETKAFVQREGLIPTTTETAKKIGKLFADTFTTVRLTYPTPCEIHSFLYDKEKKECIFDAKRIVYPLYGIVRNTDKLPSPEELFLSFRVYSETHAFAVVCFHEDGFTFVDDNFNRFRLIAITNRDYDHLLHGKANDELSTPEFNYDQEDYDEDSIVVKTPESDTLALPIGSTVIDFAFRIHREIGLHMARAICNGKEVAASAVLHDGDIVQIVRSPDAEPKLSWLVNCKTKTAQRALCRFFQTKINQLEEKAADSDEKPVRP